MKKLLLTALILSCSTKPKTIEDVRIKRIDSLVAHLENEVLDGIKLGIDSTPVSNTYTGLDYHEKLPIPLTRIYKTQRDSTYRITGYYYFKDSLIKVVFGEVENLKIDTVGIYYYANNKLIYNNTLTGRLTTPDSTLKEAQFHLSNYYKLQR